MVKRREFPSPWRVERTVGYHFWVKDDNGFLLACIFQREAPGMHDTYLTDEKAFVIANTFAKLPETAAYSGVEIYIFVGLGRDIVAAGD